MPPVRNHTRVKLLERFFTALTCVLTILHFASVDARAAGSLTITFVAVGQGDATIFEGPCGDRGLLDTPTSRSKEVLDALGDEGAGQLRWIAVSHYDRDHLGGIVDVGTADKVSVETIYDRGGGQQEKRSGTYDRYFEWATSGTATRTALTTESEFSLCEDDERVVFQVVSVETGGTVLNDLWVTQENDRGVCLRVIYLSFSMASCGDINGSNKGDRVDVESAVADELGRVDVAKVNHHGGAASSNETYVRTLDPTVAVVSVGKNGYGHPSSEAIGRWNRHGRVFQTGKPDGTLKDGQVSIITDGEGDLRVLTSEGVDQRFSCCHAGNEEENASLGPTPTRVADRGLWLWLLPLAGLLGMAGVFIGRSMSRTRRTEEEAKNEWVVRENIYEVLTSVLSQIAELNSLVQPVQPRREEADVPSMEGTSRRWRRTQELLIDSQVRHPSAEVRALMGELLISMADAVSAATAQDKEASAKVAAAAQTANELLDEIHTGRQPHSLSRLRGLFPRRRANSSSTAGRPQT